MWRKKEKLDFAVEGKVPWQTIKPDAEHSWLALEHAQEFKTYRPVQDLFDLYTVGIKTNRDDVVYDWNRAKLAERIKGFFSAYNTEVYRHKADSEADWPASI